MLASTRARAAAAETWSGGDSGSSVVVTKVMPRWLAPVWRRRLSGVVSDGAAVVPHQGMTAHGADMRGHDLTLMLLTVAVLCNAEQGGMLRGEVSTLCLCPVGPVVALPMGAPSQMPILTPGVLPGTVRPLRSNGGRGGGGERRVWWWRVVVVLGWYTEDDCRGRPPPSTPPPQQPRGAVGRKHKKPGGDGVGVSTYCMDRMPYLSEAGYDARTAAAARISGGGGRSTPPSSHPGGWRVRRSRSTRSLLNWVSAGGRPSSVRALAADSVGRRQRDGTPPPPLQRSGGSCGGHRQPSGPPHLVHGRRWRRLWRR